MIQGIAKGAPRKEIDPTMISNHLRKQEIIWKKLERYPDHSKFV